MLGADVSAFLESHHVARIDQHSQFAELDRGVFVASLPGWNRYHVVRRGE
jgi:hypothetical protein